MKTSQVIISDFHAELNISETKVLRTAAQKSEKKIATRGNLILLALANTKINASIT